MRRDLSSSFNLNRRHLVIGALGAAALPVAFATIDLTGGVLDKEALALFK